MERAGTGHYSISWSNVHFNKSFRGGPKERFASSSKQILEKVYGHCASGEMLALMGPSGCGKTSLLDLLGDRISGGLTEGQICIGGQPCDAGTLRKVVSYVGQEDSLLSCFTVQETLRYAAALSLASLTSSKRRERVQEAMQHMGITICANSRVGDPIIKGISGGQKRRLSIAVELLRASPILLLDEPTSGLDSTAALQVVEHLKGIAAQGHAIIMSIHQPSTAIYSAFNSLSLLASGRQVYFGPPGEHAVQYFAAAGLKCPAFTNPAEFFIECVNEDFEKGPAGNATGRRATELADAFLSSSAFTAASDKASALPAADPKAHSDAGRAGPCRQFLVLLVRTLHMSWKNPYIYAVRLVMYVALSFMVGTMYLNAGKTAREDTGEAGRKAANSLLPLLFYVQAFLVFMSVAILPFFLEFRDVFRRERANGHITCLPYVVANFLAHLPGVALIAIISTLLVVLLADLNGFGMFFLNLLLSLIAAESLMHLIGSAQPHYIIGMAFGAGLFGMFMLCEGFMVTPNDIPRGWKWGYTIAFHTYSFEWFVHNQFSGPRGGTFGPAILQNYNCENVNTLEDGLLLGMYALIFEIGFFFVLQFIHTGRR